MFFYECNFKNIKLYVNFFCSLNRSPKQNILNQSLITIVCYDQDYLNKAIVGIESLKHNTVAIYRLMDKNVFATL